MISGASMDIKKKTEPPGNRTAPSSYGIQSVYQVMDDCQVSISQSPENGNPKSRQPRRHMGGSEGTPELPGAGTSSSKPNTPYAGIHPVGEVSQYRKDVHQLLEKTDEVAAFRYLHCREEGRGFYYHCPVNETHYATYIPFTCMQRICPTCSDYLANNIRAKYAPIIKKVTEYTPPGWSLKLGVLTRSISLEDGPGYTARETLDAARDLYHELWGMDSGSGMIASLEVGEHSQKYHLHIIVWGKFVWHSERAERVHNWRKTNRCRLTCLMLIASGHADLALALWSHPAASVEVSGGPYLSETWKKLTGDEIVWIEKTTPERAVSEGLKYLTKFVNLDPGQLVSLHLALKGTRRLRTFGCFYNPQVQEEEEDQPVTTCPDCGFTLKYTQELDFEKWRIEIGAIRREQEFKLLDRMVKGMLKDLEEHAGRSLILTETNKSPPDPAPPAQISFLETGKQSFFDDWSSQKVSKKERSQ